MRLHDDAPESGISSLHDLRSPLLSPKEPSARIQPESDHYRGSEEGNVYLVSMHASAPSDRVSDSGQKASRGIFGTERRRCKGATQVSGASFQKG